MLRDDPIERIDAEALKSVVRDALDDYKTEDSRYRDATVVDIIVVGSVADGERDFIPNTSDLDLVVSVSGAAVDNTVLDGFAIFLREDRASAIARASNLPVTGVDVGAYDVASLDTHIEDGFGFSCARRAVTPVSMLTEASRR